MSDKNIVAWDIYEHRLQGSLGEKRHRVLWVEDYIHEDGSHFDLDELLRLANEDRLDHAAKTIHVKPLVYGIE